MKELAESTLTLYNSLLNNIDIHNLELSDFDNIYAKVKEITNNISSQKTYLSAIIWYIKSNELDIDTNPFTDEILNIGNILHEQRKKNINSPKESLKFIYWQDIIELKNSIQNIIQNDNFKKKILHKFFVLLSVYTLFPPRRITDYSNMLFITKKNNILSSDFNYLFIDRKTKKAEFIFNVYKTSKKFKQQNFDLSTELFIILNNFVIIRDIKHNTSLFNYTSHGLSTFMANYLKKFTGKPATVNTLRHSYTTYIDTLPDKLSIYDRELIAFKMGHTFMEGLLYTKLQ